MHGICFIHDVKGMEGEHGSRRRNLEGPPPLFLVGVPAHKQDCGPTGQFDSLKPGALRVPAKC